MDRMDELKKRRERRIRHILNGEGERYDFFGHSEDGQYGPHYDHERRLREDPEYEWNYRMNRWRHSTSGLERSLRVQAALSVILFAAVWALFQWNHPALAKSKAFVTSALSEELRFEQIAAWYKDKLGNAPAFIPGLDRSAEEARRADAGAAREYVVPAAGSVVEPFGSVRAGAGIVIRTGSGAEVRAMDTGLVTFAAETADTGMTVVVRHPGGVQTVYGRLEEVNVKEDDWVEAGEIIGSVRGVGAQGKDGMLYFAVNRSGDYVNPVDVIPLE